MYHKYEIVEGPLDSNNATELILPDILMGKFVDSGLNLCPSQSLGIRILPKKILITDSKEEFHLEFCS